jgi:hypothetical protein
MKSMCSVQQSIVEALGVGIGLERSTAAGPRQSPTMREIMTRKMELRVLLLIQSQNDGFWSEICT